MRMWKNPIVSINAYRDGADNSGALAFWTRDAGAWITRMTIRADGDIGIGTTAPTAQLHTTGTVRFQTFGAGTLMSDANGNISSSSDERLKNIQGNFTRGLDALQTYSLFLIPGKQKQVMTRLVYIQGFLHKM